MALYTVLYGYMDGALLAQNTQVQVQRTSNSSQAMTLALGFAGITLGTAVATFSFTNLIPSEDFELDMGQAIVTGKEIELTLAGPGGKQATTVVYVLNDAVTSAVNSNSEYTFDCVGKMPQFE